LKSELEKKVFRCISEKKIKKNH